MRRILFSLILLGGLSAQPLYEEHFTGGVTNLDWQGFFTAEDTLQVIQDTTTPEGDGWAGLLVGTPWALSYAGELSMDNYSIEAWVFVQVTPGTGGPYNGLAVRVNPAIGDFLLFSTDLDSDRRLRLTYHLADNNFMPEYIHVWDEGSVPGGLPTESSWHRMKLKVIGDSLWAYWDGTLLPGCPFVHTTNSGFGFFGVYSSIFSGIAETRVDSVVVFQEPYSVDERQISLNLGGIKVINAGKSRVVFIIEDGTDSKRLEIYSSSGRLVETISLPEGINRLAWSGTGRDGRKVKSGIYFYRIGSRGGKFLFIR